VRHTISRREFLAASAAAIAGPRLAGRAGAGTPSLKDTFKKMFLIGTALDFRSANEFNPAELDLIKSQFNVITPENSMKPGPVHPQ
jgi:endo-1,4-beta-xylanase